MSPRNFVASLISSLQTPDQPLAPSQTSSNPLTTSPPHIQTALLTLHVLFPNELLPALDLLDRNLITRLKLRDHHEAQHQSPHPAPLPGPLPGADDDAGAQSEPRHLRHLPLVQHQQVAAGEDAQRLRQPQVPSQAAQPQGARRGDVEGLVGQDLPLPHQRPPARHPPVAPHARHAQVYLVRSGQLPSRVRALSHQQQGTASYEVRLVAWSCSCPAFAFAAFPAAPFERGDGEDSTEQRVRESTSQEWRFGGLTLGTDLPVCKHLLACVLVEYSNVFAGFVEEREVSAEELAGWAAGWTD